MTRSRYARHEALVEIGAAGQARLGAARVLIVGMGGLGCPAAQYLATSGVGTLILNDFDRVDESNLPRQVLHDAGDVGDLKVDSARRRLEALSPGVRIRTIAERSDAGARQSQVASVSAVLDGTDNFGARLAVNRAAVQARVPLVSPPSADRPLGMGSMRAFSCKQRYHRTYRDGLVREQERETVACVRSNDYCSYTSRNWTGVVMTGMADRIMDRVRGRGRGQWVYTPKDFVDLGTRASVDQALSRLVGAGELRRVGRGFYDWPRESEVLKGPAPADLDAVVSALARRDGIRIMPDGMVSANRLGLTHAVPSKATYVTDGASRTLRIDGRTIQLRHAGPKVMSWAGRSAAPVVLALRWLGPHAVGDERVSRTLKRILPEDVKRDLARHCANLPGWAAPIIRILSVKQSEAG